MKLAIGLGESYCAGLLGVPQMPEHPATDNRGQIQLGGKTRAVLFIGEEIGGQW